MAILAGSKILAADFVLPAPVSGNGNGVNTIVAAAATWADLPSFPATAVISNPHPTLSLLVQVGYGAWLSATGTAVRTSVRASGGVTVASGPGAIFQGWGEIPFANFPSAGALYVQCHAIGYLTIPPGVGAVTLTAQGYRDAATGTTAVNYPSLRLTPQRFV